MDSSTPFDGIRIDEAADRILGVLQRTPLVPFEAGDERIALRLKLECLQETGSFKPRGAWNQISQLRDEERERGVVATSSGNHGRALSWAAQRAGVPATIFMPEEAYPNKIQACRDLGARVVLCATRQAAEVACAGHVREGATLIHPFASERTVEGAGTVGLEIAEDWPDVEVVVLPVGGGGLLAGSSLALRRSLGDRLRILGVEPAGAPSMCLALQMGSPVDLEHVATGVQGLCPISTGDLNLAICAETVDTVVPLSDDAIYGAQSVLVNRGSWVVEPAGAAATALVLSERLPKELYVDRTAENPLRVAAVVSGGNPDPAQYEAIRSAG